MTMKVFLPFNCPGPMAAWAYGLVSLYGENIHEGEVAVPSANRLDRRSS